MEPRMNGYGGHGGHGGDPGAPLAGAGGSGLLPGQLQHQHQHPQQQQHQQHHQHHQQALEDSKDWQGEQQQQCCLVESGRRCLKPAGNASYSKRIQKTVTQKKLKLYLDNSAHHNYICDYHKNMIQSLRSKRKRKDSEDDSGETDSEHPEVDLYQLQVNTLRRYKKHFKVSSKPGLNKAQLADYLMHHFKTIPVAEKEVLTFFIYMIKTNKSKLDRERRDEND